MFLGTKGVPHIRYENHSGKPVYFGPEIILLEGQRSQLARWAFRWRGGTLFETSFNGEPVHEGKSTPNHSREEDETTNVLRLNLLATCHLTATIRQ